MNYSIPPIADLFLDAFGLRIGGVYNPEASSANPNDPTGLFTGIEIVKDIGEAKEISGLGTPIIYPIRFWQRPLFRKYKKNGEVDVNVKMNDFRLPITSIVEFQRNKNFGVTKINGSHTSVKEIYGFNDWNITINGFFLEDNSQPQGLYKPDQQEKELLNWDDLVSSIPVESIPFKNLGIGHIMMTDLRISPIRGRPNIRSFTITALSDEAIELNINSQVAQLNKQN